MPIYKKNNKWYAKVNYKDYNGEYKSKQSKYFDTKREAKEEEIKLLTSLGKLKNDDITYAEAHKELQETKKGKGVHRRTLAKNDNYLNAVGDLGNMKVSEINQKNIDDLRIRLRDNYADSTIHSILSNVKSTINYASQKHKLQCEYIDISRDVKKKEKTQLDFYTLEEFNKFYENVDNDIYKTLFDLLFYNGLRISEARGLTWNDFDGSHISINKQYYKAQGIDKSLKTDNSYRTVPLNSRLVQEFSDLKAYYMSFPHFDSKWYVFGGLKPFAETSIRFAMRKAQKKAGLKEIRLHDFRHSCASYYIHLNYPIHLIAKLIGDNVNTVYKTYFHLYRNDLDDMVKNAEIRG